MCQQRKGCALVSLKGLFSLFPQENNGVMLSARLLQVARSEGLHYDGQRQKGKKKKKGSEKLAAIKWTKISKLDFLLASPTDLLPIFQQTTSNGTVHSKIIGKLCIYYSHKKPKRLLKQKGIREKHYFFPSLFLPPACLPYTSDSTLCIGRVMNEPATALEESVYWSCQSACLHRCPSPWISASHIRSS